MGKADPKPRTFFLNEQHELARVEKDGGGRQAKYGDIDWAERGSRIGTALRASKAKIHASKDPVRDRHYFLCAVPRAVPKVSTSKTKPPAYSEAPHYAGEHSRVFRRLGLDLIDVTEDGEATVHATPERMERLLSTAATLHKEALPERARWVTIDRFDPVPGEFRVDQQWLSAIPKGSITDVIVELQPLLNRVEVEDVLRGLVSLLSREHGEAFTGTGTDFSGRKWFRGQLRREAVAEIASEFYSVQSLHPPYLTPVVAAARGRKRASVSRVAQSPPPPPPLPSIPQLPTVAVVDTGVPEGHAELGPYRRGAYRSPDSYSPYWGDHGSFVASRVVFGDLDFATGVEPRSHGACRFLDVMVAQDAQSIVDKAVLPALEAVVGTYPDVRVFNLSFAERYAVSEYHGVEQRERLINARDLDNFVFARDVIVVVSAGNSQQGIVPAKDYPQHLDEQAWQLAAWPAGFNTLTCGAMVEALHPEGLVKTMGWPSPFTRVGPGMARAPIPEFGAHGGNVDDGWNWRPSLGVWGCTATGDWEDKAGTSFAAPLLARSAALALKHLEAFCPSGGRPFAATAKAFLALTASRVALPPAVAALADRTIGAGAVDLDRLGLPLASSAVFVWQGVIDGPGDIVRVQLPIPLGWLKEAVRPELRLVCCWDPPANDAVRDLWATRKVTAHLRAAPGEKALRGSRGAHASYPKIDRTYDLSRDKIAKLDPQPTESLWDLELSYEQIAEYHPAITFSPQQRVAFAAELRDVGEKPVSPQGAVQALPAAASMTRLGVPTVPAAVPIIVRR